MKSIQGKIRWLAEKMAAKRSITFLGTGPSKPITEHSGKSNRENTSTLITYEDTNYRIDIPSKFNEDIKFDYLLITHTHSDAYDGFSKIKDRKFIFALPSDLSDFAHEQGKWKKKDLKEMQPNNLGKLKVIPFPVVHDIIHGSPTYGYQFIMPDDYKITYSSDCVKIPEKCERYYDNIDMLVMDGASWKGNLATHFGVIPFLGLMEEKNWKIKQVYFTQVGRAVPTYEEAQREIHKEYPNADLAYDGLKVSF